MPACASGETSGTGAVSCSTTWLSCSSRPPSLPHMNQLSEKELSTSSSPSASPPLVVDGHGPCPSHPC